MALEISIGTMSKRTGLSVSAIRYYDDLGLIQSNRNIGGHRRFQRAQIRRVSFIMAAQKFGFTLPRIKQLLDGLPNSKTPDKADWERLAKIFQNDIDHQIHDLKKLRDNLTGCIGCGCLSLNACQIFNSNDHLGKNDTGPVNLK